jgi:hypothetical protein
VRYADAVSALRHPHEVADPTGTDTRETWVNKPNRVVQRKHRKKKGKKVSLRNQ